MQEEDFDEDEGIYDELNLDEEEEKFGLVGDDHGNESDESEDVSEGRLLISLYAYDLPDCRFVDLPPRTPSKKQQHDDESVSSSKRDSSPVLKKATATLQLRSRSPIPSLIPLVLIMPPQNRQ